ncbi:hypothetical protein EON63_23810 [archaeon]|nr:MAG: hypothetical protein EON63_23810 [archaeon]
MMQFLAVVLFLSSLMPFPMAFRLGLSNVMRLAQRNAVNRMFSAAKGVAAPVAPTGPLPIGVLVTIEIKPDRISEFLEVIKVDAQDSVEKEYGGCLKFDVLAHDDNPNKFTFYEVKSHVRHIMCILSLFMHYIRYGCMHDVVYES